MRQLILSLLLVFVGTVGFSQNSEKCKGISESLVKIISTKDLGYGFFVDKDIVVTSYSTISQTTKATIEVFGTNKKYKVLGYLEADKNKDLVLLKIDSCNEKPLKISSASVKPEDKVYLAAIKDTKPECVENKVNSLKDFGGGANLIELSSDKSITEKGFPVINENKEVVGVLISSPDITNNLNFAIPSEALTALMKNMSKDVKKLELLTPVADIYKGKPQDDPKKKALDDLINQGNNKILQKDYNGAIAKFDNALKLFPNDADVFVFRGTAKYYLLQYKDAIDDFNKAISIQSEYAEAYDLRGICKAELTDKDGACADWMKAYELGFTHAYKLLKEFCDIEKMLKDQDKQDKSKK